MHALGGCVAYAHVGILLPLYPCRLVRTRTTRAVRQKLERNLRDVAKLQAVFAAKKAKFIPPVATTRRLLTSFNFCVGHDSAADTANLVRLASLLRANVLAGTARGIGLIGALRTSWADWGVPLKPFLRRCMASLLAVAARPQAGAGVRMGAAGTGAGSGTGAGTGAGAGAGAGAQSNSRGAPPRVGSRSSVCWPVLDFLRAITDLQRFAAPEHRPQLAVLRRLSMLLLTDCDAVHAVRACMCGILCPTFDAPTPAETSAALTATLKCVSYLCCGWAVFAIVPSRALFACEPGHCCAAENSAKAACVVWCDVAPDGCFSWSAAVPPRTRTWLCLRRRCSRSHC